jgi:hypothetical protein
MPLPLPLVPLVLMFANNEFFRYPNTCVMVDRGFEAELLRRLETIRVKLSRHDA